MSRQFIRPPLLFPEMHTDEAGVLAVMALLPELKRRGYTHLCMEFNDAEFRDLDKNFSQYILRVIDHHARLLTDPKFCKFYQLTGHQRDGFFQKIYSYIADISRKISAMSSLDNETAEVLFLKICALRHDGVHHELKKRFIEGKNTLSEEERKRHEEMISQIDDGSKMYYRFILINAARKQGFEVHGIDHPEVSGEDAAACRARDWYMGSKWAELNEKTRGGTIFIVGLMHTLPDMDNHRLAPVVTAASHRSQLISCVLSNTRYRDIDLRRSKSHSRDTVYELLQIHGITLKESGPGGAFFARQYDVPADHSTLTAKDFQFLLDAIDHKMASMTPKPKASVRLKWRVIQPDRPYKYQAIIRCLDQGEKIVLPLKYLMFVTLSVYISGEPISPFSALPLAPLVWRCIDEEENTLDAQADRVVAAGMR